MSILLSPIGYAKKASFDMPACEKLGNDAASASSASEPAELKVTTTEESSSVIYTPGSATMDSGNTAKAQLNPVKLTDEQDGIKVGKDGKVKIKVQKNVSKKKQEDNSPEKVYNDAKKVNITPLALMETENEAQQKLEAISEAEKMQLTDLWSATINRNPDIQFVIQRMQPHSDPNHATSTVMKVLGGALFSAASAVPMMMPGAGFGNAGAMLMYSGTSSAGSAINNLLGSVDAKNQKKQQISQEQATMLYKMVRDTADKLVANYRNYKKMRNQYEKATADLEDLRTMAKQAEEGAPASEIIKTEYFLRKQTRDVENITDDAKVNRQALCDLAGPEAVAKLDDQVDEEIAMVKNMTGGEMSKPGEATPAENVQLAEPSPFKRPL